PGPPPTAIVTCKNALVGNAFVPEVRRNGRAPPRRRARDRMPSVGERLSLPGFVNAHSHAFQRALRGRTEGGDFWAWRETMLEEGARVGLAPHSVRACPPDWLEELGRYAERERLPLHVHADEQPREIEECVAEHGVRPIELLARAGCLGSRTTVVHATHADDHELDLLAEAGAR